MQFVPVLAGAIVLVSGAYTLRNPMRPRSWVSAEKWRSAPRQAERKHRRLSQVIGGLSVAFGAVLIVWILAT